MAWLPATGRHTQTPGLAACTPGLPPAMAMRTVSRCKEIVVVEPCRPWRHRTPSPLPPDCRCLELRGPSQKRRPHGRKAGLCIGPYAAHHPERWASMASAQATIRRADTGHMARASRHTTARRQRQCQDNERDEWWKWPFRLPPEAGTARIRRARPDSDCAGFAGYRPIPPARCRHAAQSVPWRYASPCPG